MPIFRRNAKKQEVDIDAASISDGDEIAIAADEKDEIDAEVKSVASSRREPSSVRSTKKHLTSPSFEPYEEHDHAHQPGAVISLCRSCAEQLISPAIARAPIYEPVRSSTAATLLSQQQAKSSKKIDLSRVKTQLPSSSRRQRSSKSVEEVKLEVEAAPAPVSASSSSRPIEIKKEPSSVKSTASSRQKYAPPSAIRRLLVEEEEEKKKKEEEEEKKEEAPAPAPVEKKEPMASAKSSFTVHRVPVDDVDEEYIHDALLKEFTRPDGTIDRRGLDAYMTQLRCELVSASNIRFPKMEEMDDA